MMYKCTHIIMALICCFILTNCQNKNDERRQNKAKENTVQQEDELDIPIDLAMELDKEKALLLEEFFDKLNGELITNDGKTVKISTNQQEKRVVNLILNEYGKKEKEQLVKDFLVDVMANDEVRLSFNNDYWFAEAKCKASFKGKSINISFILKYFQNPQDSTSKWSIVGVKGGFVQELIKKSNRVGFSPVDNELEFTRLGEALSQNPYSVLDENIPPNYLMLVLYLAQNQDLKVEFVREVQYHFLQMPNWIFRMKKYDKVGRNGGMLIDTIFKANSDEKNCYLAKQLNLHYPSLLLPNGQPCLEKDNYLQTEPPTYKKSELLDIAQDYERLMENFNEDENAVDGLYDIFRTSEAKVFDDIHNRGYINLRTYLDNWVQKTSKGEKIEHEIKINKRRPITVEQRGNMYFALLDFEKTLKTKKSSQKRQLKMVIELSSKTIDCIILP